MVNTEMSLCSKCNTAFEQCPVPVKKIVVTACFHAYCLGCLKNWVSELHKPCPLCRHDIMRHASSKDFPIIWKIFIKILKLNPSFISDVFSKHIGTKESCSTCLEELPPLSVKFLYDEKRLQHMSCEDPLEKGTEITVMDVVQVVKLFSETQPKLKLIMTPRDPTLWERFKNSSWKIMQEAMSS